MQPLSDHIQITTSNYRGRTVFTHEYWYYEKKYSWEATAFIAHCLSQWEDRFEHLLDFWEEGHNPIELEIVDYWGPKFVERFGKEFPQCDADWYRNVFRAELRSLVLPRKLIEEYLIRCGSEEWETEENLQKYLKGFSPYFGADIKPLPSDWLNIGCDKGGSSLKLSDDILRLAKDMDINRVVKIISWILGGFTKKFDIFYPDSKNNIKINTGLCNTLSKNSPEFFGTCKLSGEWFKELYKAKFLSIRIPERLLKPLFTPYAQG